MALAQGKFLSAGKIVIICIIVVLLLSVGLYFYIYSGDKVGSIIVTLYQKDVTGTELEGALRLEVRVISQTPEDYSGEANLFIDYEGSERTCDGYVTISEGYGSKIVQFTEFVVGNGNYSITASVEGKKGRVAYDVGNIVEAVANTMELTPGEKGTLNVIMTDRNGLGLRFNISQNALRVSLDLVLSKGGESREFSKPGVVTSLTNIGLEFSRFGEQLRGDYTFQFTLTNDLVKPGSPYHVIYNYFTQTLDTTPVAYAGPDQTYSLGPLEMNKQVTIDASGSIDDGTITKYNWTFADPLQQMNNYEETPDNAPDGSFDGIHTFRLGMDFYEIFVSVSDDNEITGVLVPQTGTCQVNVTVSRFG